MTRLLLPSLVACLCLLLAACEHQSVLQGQMADELQTPEALATFLAGGLGTPTPLPDDLVRALETPQGDELHLMCLPSPLASLLPPDPLTGEPIEVVDDLPNDVLGSPYSGNFASEQQLGQMGRLCGAKRDVGWGRTDPWLLLVRLDVYATSPGAKEAFRREALHLRVDRVSDEVQLDDGELSLSIGQEQQLRGQRADTGENYYTLLFRRRNVIGELELSYVGRSPTGNGQPEPVLDYAAQLDRNIEAAAAQQ